MPNHRKRPPDAEVIRLFVEGISMLEIARRFGGAIQLLLRSRHDYARLKKQHLTNRDFRLRWRKPEERQKAVEAYRQFGCLAKAAKFLNTNEHRLKALLVEEGVRILSQGEAQCGDNNPAWRGGRRQTEDGYIYVYAPEHPYAVHRTGNRKGCVLEHRLVMEKVLGRYLLPTEVVHHKNKKRSDNRPTNLELFATNAAHLAAELKGQCPKWTVDGWNRIVEGRRRCGALGRKNRRAKKDARA